MQKLLLLFLSALLSLGSYAQKNDSLFVQQGEDGWVLPYRIKSAETVFSVARKFHMPPAILADFNEINIKTALKEGTVIAIPIGAYNLVTNGMKTNDMRPIYHRLRAGESLRKIAKNSNTSQRKLLDWNNRNEGDIYDGQVLTVGWILFDATIWNNSQPATQPVAPASPPVKPSVVPRQDPPPVPQVRRDTSYFIIPPQQTDTNLAEQKSEAEMLYDEQTLDGTQVTKEKGPAAFFSSSNSNPTYYYAFHNGAARGAIIKVRNTNNGKIIFVKVLGPIPNTAIYHNCIIGISSKARAALGVRDEKAWCELSYAK